MEAFIEIYTKGSKLEKTEYPDKKYFHLWVPDEDKYSTPDDFWDIINDVIRDMEKGRGACSEDRFPNYMSYRRY